MSLIALAFIENQPTQSNQPTSLLSNDRVDRGTSSIVDDRNAPGGRFKSRFIELLGLKRGLVTIVSDAFPYFAST